MAIPSFWLPPDWRGRRRFVEPINWAHLPEFDVGIALLREKKDYGHKNTWSIYIRPFNDADVKVFPVMAQSVITSSPGATQTITSDSTWNQTSNQIEAIAGGDERGYPGNYGGPGCRFFSVDLKSRH
jgi:hypothetical protein